MNYLMSVETQTSGIHGKYVITNCEDFDFYIFMYYDSVLFGYGVSLKLKV